MIDLLKALGIGALCTCIAATVFLIIWMMMIAMTWHVGLALTVVFVGGSLVAYFEIKKPTKAP